MNQYYRKPTTISVPSCLSTLSTFEMIVNDPFPNDVLIRCRLAARQMLISRAGFSLKLCLKVHFQG